MKVKIGGIKEVSLVDVLFYPSFVIWFSGCNFRCPWCHNGPLALGNGKNVNVSHIIEKVKENKKFVDFVQITGGEPTLQKDAVLHIFREVKKMGLKTSLNTNGSNPKVIENLIENE
ncbi:MAG TPA: radical SAM protein, partial [Candidatus Aenigmarchaeota archaeon]|nr:radical SAM protein [Candidatus Aenigmarchaeota archaeon]